MNINDIPQDLAIFVVAHKRFKLPENIAQDTRYIPTQVGLHPEDFGYLRDNQLDNIAAKNPHYNELTALYFIWKNIKTPLIGLVHYRRYFTVKHSLLEHRLWKVAYRTGLISYGFRPRNRPLTSDKLLQILDETGADLIVPYHSNFWWWTNLQKQYASAHHARDWQICKSIMLEKYPEYSETWNKVENGRIFYPANMFIGKKSVMDNYFEWLFTILFAAETQIDYSQYTPYQ